MFSIEEYITNLVSTHQDEFPHLDQKSLYKFISKVKNNYPDMNLRNTRELYRARKILLEPGSSFWTTEQREILDLCFPASLGPFGNLIFRQMLPNNVGVVNNMENDNDSVADTIVDKLDEAVEDGNFYWKDTKSR